MSVPAIQTVKGRVDFFAKDIEPYMDSVFENNILLTLTEIREPHRLSPFSNWWENNGAGFSAHIIIRVSSFAQGKSLVSIRSGGISIWQIKRQGTSKYAGSRDTIVSDTGNQAQRAVAEGSWL